METFQRDGNPSPNMSRKTRQGLLYRFHEGQVVNLFRVLPILIPRLVGEKDGGAAMCNPANLGPEVNL
jgi:hypothetical protein